MLLATRCPFCETVFRLQPAQLALRRGLVRCGHCHEVFDATSSLFETAEGADFSTATPIPAVAATEMVLGRLPDERPDPLPGAPLPDERPGLLGNPPPARPASPDFSAEAWDPWAPAADAVIDERLRHSAAYLPHVGIATGAGVAVTPRSATEPELPHHASSANIPRDDEPMFPDAPLEPFAYDSDAPAVAPATAPAAEVPELTLTHTPSVWHKTARPNERPLDEPVLHESATLYDSVPDGEPRFNTLPQDTAHTIAPAHVSTEPFAATPPEDGVDPFPVVRETRAPAPSRAGWIVFGTLLALLLIVALLAQLAWWQRETVMVYFPRTQMVYAQACERLGCQLTPPHDIDGLQVEPSDLRQVDGPHKLELKMPLHNRFNVALAYPAIELTLLDDKNNVALRRVLWPQDYVAPGTSVTAGLAAHSTQTMIVRLDTGNAIASNFRVQIFYP
jgi:predicted Zn finger-like uncharacterized protein